MSVVRAVSVALLAAVCACAPPRPSSASATPIAKSAPVARPTVGAARTAVGTLDGVVASLQADPSADYGLVVEDLGSGERVAVNESRVFPSGSVYKLALAWHVLQQVDRGQLRLGQSLEIVDDDTVEDEPLGGVAPGETPTVGEALEAMFSVSSNAAAHAFLRTLGRREFNQTMDTLGLVQTRVPEQPELGEAVTTADDIARLLRLIATDQGLSGSTQSALRRLLALGGAPDALRETLDDDVRVLDKTGNLEDASNVGALLVTPHSTVILVVLDQGVDPGDARTVISQLGQAAVTAVTAVQH